MAWSPSVRSRFSAVVNARSLKALPAYWYVGHPNLGDALAPVLLEHYLRRPVGWVAKASQGKILSTGSLAALVSENDLVLGSGLIEDRRVSLPRGALVLSVRGPMTRDRLGPAQVPEVYGDPALLIPRVTGLRAVPGESIGVIPHFIDNPAVASASLPAGAVIIDVQEPWRRVVDAIRHCRAVVSSSLHGIVVAEAFHIPAVWVSLGDKILGGNFKFNDYYLGTGRPTRDPVCLEAGLEIAASGDVPPPDIDSTAVERSFDLAREEIMSG
jgi:pyruvyltransferase